LKTCIKINQLQRHTATAARGSALAGGSPVATWPTAAVEGLSDETRFDAAYKAIMQCAMVGLMANGFQPVHDTMPGHHQTMIQSLGTHLGRWYNAVWVVLDSLAQEAQSQRLFGRPDRTCCRAQLYQPRPIRF
jgi:hypothetical protein